MAKKISVWPDLSDDYQTVWVVSIDDIDDCGAGTVIDVIASRDDAIDEARSQAQARELPLEILPTYVGGDDGRWEPYDGYRPIS